jgi:hypothetical protein
MPGWSEAYLIQHRPSRDPFEMSANAIPETKIAPKPQFSDWTPSEQQKLKSYKTAKEVLIRPETTAVDRTNILKIAP